MSSPTFASRIVVLDQGRKLAKGHPTRSFTPGGAGGLSRWLMILVSRLRTFVQATARSISSTASDLDVPQGQFVALMGPNGAGKSTLLKSLYGMTTIKDGSIEWQGKNIAGYKSKAILAEVSPSYRRAAVIFLS